jgi:hypothetical protein
MLHSFSLESLKNLDMGKASEAFQHHVRRAALDCLDRPLDGKPRKVVLEIAMVPDPEQDGACDKVKLQIRASSALPKHQTKVYSLGARVNGQLVFNEDALDNVDQGTLGYGDDQ